MFLGGCPCCGPCWRCFTDGTNYECVGPDDTPKDGWTPVGKCHPDEESCAKECPPIVYGGVCAYREEEEYCGPSDELPGVRGDWCRVVDIPDDKSCADKGAAFCCDAYSDDLKVILQSFQSYVVGQDVDDFTVVSEGIAGPFVMVSNELSSFRMEAPMADGVSTAVVFMENTTGAGDCSISLDLSVRVPLLDDSNTVNDVWTFRYENGTASGNGDFAGIPNSGDNLYKRSWSDSFVQRDMTCHTLLPNVWNEGPVFTGEADVGGYWPNGYPKPNQKRTYSFSWPEFFYKKIAPPNPFWYCSRFETSNSNTQNLPYCPTDDLIAGTEYYSKQEDAALNCFYYCYFEDYVFECATGDPPLAWRYPNFVNQFGDCTACESLCNGGQHLGYKESYKILNNPPSPGESFPYSVTLDGGEVSGLLFQPPVDNFPGYKYSDNTNDPIGEFNPNEATVDPVRGMDCSVAVRSPIPGGGAGPAGPVPDFMAIYNKLFVGGSGASVGFNFDRGGENSYDTKKISFAGKEKTFLPDEKSGGIGLCVDGINQDNWKGPITVTVECRRWYNYLLPDLGIIDEGSFEVTLSLPDNFFESYCWQCPDQPKPTGAIDYEKAGFVPANTPPTRNRTMPTTTTGPGTHLANLLKWFGIKAKEKGCGCKSMEKKMNQGPQWCRDHKEEILDHLAKEAKKRGLPFVRLAAEKLVDLAIRRAERDSA